MAYSPYVKCGVHNDPEITRAQTRELHESLLIMVTVMEGITLNLSIDGHCWRNAYYNIFPKCMRAFLRHQLWPYYGVMT